MEVAKIHVNGVCAQVLGQKTLTSGMVGATISLQFDSAWDGLEKMAVFQANKLTRDRVISGDNVAVPHEVLEAAGERLRVGVYGINGDGTLIIPTVWAELGYIKPGTTPSGDPSTNHTLPVWAQFMAKVANGELDGASAYKVAVDNGFEGTEEEWLASLVGPNGPQGVQGVQGKGTTITTSRFTKADGLVAGKSGVQLIVNTSDPSAGMSQFTSEYVLDGDGIDHVSVEMLEAGSEPTASLYTVMNQRNLALSIPRGADGKTPYIGENGNWWVGEVDTGVSAGGSQTVKLDTTLSVEGQAADAKAVGDKLTELEKKIPDDVSYTLTVATPEALGGVKPVTATEAMTQPVGVDATGALFTEPGGGDKWEFINEVTAEGDLADLAITVDANGDPISLRKAYVEVYQPVVETITTELNMRMCFRANMSGYSGGTINCGTNPVATHTGGKVLIVMVEIVDGRLVMVDGSYSTNYNAATYDLGRKTSVYLVNGVPGFAAQSVIDAVRYGSYATVIGTGTKMTLYGVRC